ncbi:MAG: DeoR/GlpR transcriptional regulator [Anaerolineales bacterium]|nr:DeoR/GlpR transcriptional regulator [Anaerolineales bacterium]
MKSIRHLQIRDLVNENGQITVAELNDLLKVSEATIRRDLEELDQLGWIRRTHGGAIRVERAEKEPPILQRQDEQSDEKRRIGQAAAQLVQPHQTIFLGSGSTVSMVVPYIQDLPLTVITNSLPVINQLAGRDSIELIVIGGQFRQSELSMVGHVAEQAIREFRADLVLMGMRAIDAGHGFTSDYVAEAMTDRAILQMAPRCAVMADHSKFGRVSTVFLAPVTAVQTIISDQGLQPELAAELREKGLELILA